jgi:hypothetical protein
MSEVSVDYANRKHDREMETVISNVDPANHGYLGYYQLGRVFYHLGTFKYFCKILLEGDRPISEEDSG